MEQRERTFTNSRRHRESDVAFNQLGSWEHAFLLMEPPIKDRNGKIKEDLTAKERRSLKNLDEKRADVLKAIGVTPELLTESPQVTKEFDRLAVAERWFLTYHGSNRYNPAEPPEVRAERLKKASMQKPPIVLTNVYTQRLKFAKAMKKLAAEREAKTTEETEACLALVALQAAPL